MIKTPTVFVLGAGASMPYGFPSGVSLGKTISQRLTNQNGPLAMALRGNGANHDEVLAFPAQYRRSGRESIDAFVESRREFLPMAKLAIPLTIGEFERDDLLYQKSAENTDWMGYLFNKMLCPTTDEFEENKLKVITFNFDRSFERRLFLTVSSCYGLPDEKALELCQRAVPVLHIHGDFGEPGWGAQRSPQSRAYVPLSVDDPSDEIRRCAERIKIIHEDIPTETIERAQAWLIEAKRVCFIGFGYHSLNLKRLKVAALSDPSRHEVAGTVFGLEEGEILAIKSEFGNNIVPHCMDARIFLRKTKFVHL